MASDALEWYQQGVVALPLTNVALSHVSAIREEQFFMNRLSAGFISGGGGAVLLIALSIANIPFVGFLVVLAVGIVAGILIARNPQFAGKTGGAGALAGLLAGAVLFVAAFIVAVITVNSPAGQRAISQVVQTVQAQQTATATATAHSGSTTTPAINAQSLAQFGSIAIGCFSGLLYLGISTGLGAAAGAIAGRNNQAPQVPHDAFYYGTPQGGYPPQPGYPPPSSPYGSQEQPGYPPPQQPPPQQ